MPAKYRTWLAPGVIVTKGIERCLWLYPVERWAELAPRASALPLTNPTAREFQRLFFGGASDYVPDKQGRIILQSYLREYANIDSQAVIIGLDDHFEIWNPESRREQEQKGDSNPEWRAEQFSSLGF